MTKLWPASSSLRRPGLTAAIASIDAARALPASPRCRRHVSCARSRGDVCLTIAFAIWAPSDWTSPSATSGSRGRLTSDESFAAISIVRGRRRHRGPRRGPRPAGLKGRRLRRFARRSRASNAAPLGYSPAEDGPSRPVSRRRVDDLRVRGTRTNITNFLENANPRAAQTFARQRAEPRRGRVFPSAAWRACHRSISGRSQRLGRPRPRSRTGRGISG